ncbi:Signal transduction histidine kinase [Chitinophaga sp. YR627]|uniref:tetratricopeptide repeat-containing sensor histidine kinase n=1 Tax=Chitinophaga sp. YR627 TaxID=1881041 RepID=UPI0008F411A7|nr:ATP-binding protein [Chitinophaga sp. YR627]SFN33001.1 Signal transduction histidine kinase [Chitinophaga sp. YR627]
MNGRQFIQVLCCLIFGISGTLYAQDQGKADSIKRILLETDTLSPVSQMAMFAKIAAYSSSPDEVLLYADTLLELAATHHEPNYIIEALQSKGVAYRLMGNLKKSLENLFRSANLAIEKGAHKRLTTGYLEIANTYMANNDLKNAILYNKKAVGLIRLHGNKEQLAINLLNTGYSYYTLNELDSALLLYNEAEPIFAQIGLKIGQAYAVGNKALVYWKQGNNDSARQGLLRAIDMLGPLGDQFGMADYHNQLGKLYAEEGKTEDAIRHTGKALEIAKALDLKEQMRDASLLLSNLYKTRKDYARAFDYQSRYIVYKDSIENSGTTRQLANLRTEFEVSLKEKEIVLLEKRQLLNRIYIIVAVFFLLLAVLMLLYFRQRFLNARLLAVNEQKYHDERIRNLLNTQETKALQAMVQGQESERKRLARELHNHFGSLMATIKVNMHAVDEKAIPNYQTLSVLIDQACSDIRNLSHSLNVGIADDFGLVPALVELTAHLRQANSLEVEFSAAMCEQKMEARNEIIIYRIVQELVSNVLKHAGATKLSISLTCFDEENIINIIVQDDGIGFDVEEEITGSGMGLNTLKEMIVDLRGEIRFDSNPASGTTVNIDLPVTPITLN